MTVSANKGTTPAKAATAAKSETPVKGIDPNTVVKDDVIKEEVKSEETKPTGMDRIPKALAENSILADFCRQYLGIHDEIFEYNKEVLVPNDSEYTPAKVMEKARELAHPTDANVKPNEDVKKVVDEFEKAANALSLARKAVLNETAKVLGITLSATAERDPIVEAPLKEKRKIGVALGDQLMMIANMTTDKNASTAVEEFLKNMGMPAIGRDQIRTFGNEGASTPKYRVTVTVTDDDGNVKVEEKGFTKASQALAKFYEKGKAPMANALREAWEKAGNSADKVVSPVEFVDETVKLHYTITKN